MIEIKEFDKIDQTKVREFILDIQNIEFNLGFGEYEQPDLIDTKKFYEGGGFWIAKIEGNIVGTIGLQILHSQNSVLRKMFVKKEFRGREFNIAQSLFYTLFEFAKKKGINAIWLDTPAVATASHKFYERNGFVQTDKQNLPEGYVYPDKNSKIYKLTIS